MFAPEFQVGHVFLKVDSTCPVVIESLSDPACGEGHPPPTGAIVTVFDTGTGYATAGWVIAALAIVAVIILIITVALVGFLYLRVRNKMT